MSKQSEADGFQNFAESRLTMKNEVGIETETECDKPLNDAVESESNVWTSLLSKSIT